MGRLNDQDNDAGEVTAGTAATTSGAEDPVDSSAIASWMTVGAGHRRDATTQMAC